MVPPELMGLFCTHLPSLGVQGSAEEQMAATVGSPWWGGYQRGLPRSLGYGSTHCVLENHEYLRNTKVADRRELSSRGISWWGGGQMGTGGSLQGPCPCPRALQLWHPPCSSALVLPQPPFLHRQGRQQVRGKHPQQPHQHQQNQGLAKAGTMPAPNPLAQAAQGPPGRWPPLPGRS